jgi:microsomal dipeptidase-like Zn-dependent dipeptidase
MVLLFMPRKQDKKQPEKNETLTAIQGMKTVALGLDFSAYFDAIRELYHPIEINQIRRDVSEEVLVEPLEFETLTELVDAVKKQKKVTILTKQPSVIEKFCRDNSLEVTIHEWKL